MEHGRGFRLNRKFTTVLVGFLISVATITGCATSNTTERNATTAQNKSTASPGQFTNYTVATYIRDSEMNHKVTDIQIISMKNTKGSGFAFASFKADGEEKYANIFRSKGQGVGISTFSAPQVKNSPLQADQQVAQNGYTSITGVVVNSPSIKSIVITFSNGNVTDVPVSDGHFSLFGQMATSEAGAYLRHMIGVSNQGAIVVNQS